jgi:peptidoglycan/xylan/chitin deacetylase (PgdA/CDA1 family)
MNRGDSLKRPRPAISPKNLVMTFHHVPSRRWFQRALKTIGAIYKFRAAEDLIAYFYNDRSFHGGCLVCFDDGERSFYDKALPVLADLGIPVLVFVSPGVVREGRNYWFQDIRFLREELGEAILKREIATLIDRPLAQVRRFGLESLLKEMTLSEIRRLLESAQRRRPVVFPKAGNMTKEMLVEISRLDFVRIGAHTMNHPTLANEPEIEAEWEIRQSIQELSTLLGRKIECFAYPNGQSGLDFGSRERILLRRNGIKLGFTMDDGFFGKRTDPLAIPRGALDGSPRENQGWIFLKILALPLWRKVWKQKEAEERRQLRRERPETHRLLSRPSLRGS